MGLLKVLAARFTEPSSWAGLATALTMLGVNVPPSVSQSVIYILAGACGLLAFFIPEKKG